MYFRSPCEQGLLPRDVRQTRMPLSTNSGGLQSTEATVPTRHLASGVEREGSETCLPGEPTEKPTVGPQEQ